MEQLVILVFKIERANKEKAHTINKFMSERFSNIEGYIVRVIVLPKESGDPEVECIYPNNPMPDDNILKILNEIQKEINTWAEEH